MTLLFLLESDVPLTIENHRNEVPVCPHAQAGPPHHSGNDYSLTPSLML